MTAMNRKPTRQTVVTLLWVTVWLLCAILIVLAAGWISPGNWLQYELVKLYGP
jgi:hypothetical protein